MPALEGFRVVDLTTGIAGPYCTKLFVDAGAEVIKVEAAGGDWLRGWTASGQRPGLLFEYLNGNKKSAIADDEFVGALAPTADLIVEDLGPGVAESTGLLDIGVPVLSISRFGRGGPWSGRTANEFTLQAQVGSTDYRGIPGEEPVSAGGRIGEYVVASFAAVAGLAAMYQYRATGQAVHADVSQHEAMILSFQVFRQVNHVYDPGRWLGRSFEVPSIEPAKDGYVGFCTITSQQYSDFCQLIGAPELAAPEMMFGEARMANRELVWQKIRDYTMQHTVEEIVDVASAMRIPVSPVGNGKTVLDTDQFEARGVYVDHPAGFRQPRVPYQIGGVEPRPFGPAPKLDEHGAEVRALAAHGDASRSAAKKPRTRKRLPLAGVKVADFSAFWAGPVAVNVLNALGADVIKIESIQRPDGMRFSSGLRKADLLWEYSPVTHCVQVGKRAITLDLQTPAGLALAKRMVEWADLVVENYAPRVMENFGLGWDVVHAVNPRAVMCRMPAFGLDGPWRERTGFAMTIEQASGLAYVTGHPQGPPMVPRGLCDPMGGMHAAFAMMLALEETKRTRKGRLVEVALIEPALNAAAEQALEYSANGVLLERQGNRSPYAAPQGVYRAKEDDWWVALSIETDAEWQRLVGALGSPEWATDARLATKAGRHQHHDLIDTHLKEYFAALPRDLAAEQLISAGVPAAPLNNAYFVGLSPHHQVRPFFQWMQHAVAGWTPYPSFPFTWNGEFLPFERPAPLLGEHNEEVLSTVLGLSAGEIAELANQKVIGTRPAWL